MENPGYQASFCMQDRPGQSWMLPILASAALQEPQRQCSEKEHCVGCRRSTFPDKQLESTAEPACSLTMIATMCKQNFVDFHSLLTVLSSTCCFQVFGFVTVELSQEHVRKHQLLPAVDRWPEALDRAVSAGPCARVKCAASISTNPRPTPRQDPSSDRS